MQHNNLHQNNQLTEITSGVPTPSMITSQPMLGEGDNKISSKQRLFDDSNPTSGIYRHRSYDNLQNGKSLSPAYRLKQSIQLPHSPSFDRNSPLPLLHRTILNNNTNNVPVPTEFKYYSPQRRNVSDSHLPRYPYHKNRAVPRQNSEQLSDVRTPQPLPLRPKYKKQEVHFELKSPTNKLTIRECDFGGGGDSSEFDTMLKDSQTFRISKRDLYQQYGSPGGRKKERYSNVYEYSFNIDLNSIIEDAASDSS